MNLSVILELLNTVFYSPAKYFQNVGIFVGILDF